MTKTFSLGFLGGGSNSAVGATHFISSQMDSRFRVEAGCFSRQSRVNYETAEQWNVSAERTYQSTDQLLVAEKGNLDAIVVLTPTPDHTPSVIQALQLGYAVICEKSLAATVKDAIQIRQTEAATRGFLAVTYNYTGYPMLRELKSMIRRGQLGRIEQVHIEMPQEGYARLGRDGDPMVPQQWRLRDGAIPTIALDLGVHVHHVIDFLTGEKPFELIASQSSQGKFRQVIDNSMCIARYTNNLECSIWFSKAALGYRNGLRVRIFGETGSAEWYQMDPEFLTIADNKGHRTIIDRASVDAHVAHLARYNRFKSGHPAGFLEAFANLYCDIADAMDTFIATGVHDSEYVYSAQHALEGLTMLDAMAQSSRDRCWKPVVFPQLAED